MTGLRTPELTEAEKTGLCDLGRNEANTYILLVALGVYAVNKVLVDGSIHAVALTEA